MRILKFIYKHQGHEININNLYNLFALKKKL